MKMWWKNFIKNQDKINFVQIIEGNVALDAFSSEELNTALLFASYGDLYWENWIFEKKYWKKQ